MRISHKILLLIDSIYKNRKKNCFRILNYHNIPKQHLSNFKNQINFLSNNYNIISPNQFEKYNKSSFETKTLMLTFDDGFKSLKSILPILEQYKIKAIFFVIKDFIFMNDSLEINKFIKENLRFKFDISKLDDQNLNITDLREIIKLGHTIGYHTKSHLDLGNVKDMSILEKEIIFSANELENSFFDMKFKYFAYPFGSSLNISKNSYELIKQKYKYVFSGIRGDNNDLISENKNIFKRDEISPHYSIKLLKAILNGNSDFYYKIKYNELLNKYV